MSYKRYEVDITQTHGVVLRGWPEGLGFRSPAKITTIEDTRVLHDALTSGECVWVKLTCLEKESRAKDRRNKIASGEVVVKQRKKRSDAGKPRGPRKLKAGEKRLHEDDNNVDKENNGPRKRQQVAQKAPKLSQLPPMPKSRETVNTTDESKSNED
ncbi:hypothetical protein C0991_001954 [Blastosporella zonata]|nr:hypothetical protein C0991_001954 [Blastosporella zonata]